MMGYGYGMGVGGWIAVTIFWVGLITLVVWTLSRALPPGGDRGADARSGGDDVRESAEDIVDRRFATGELDEDTYRSMRAALRASRGDPKGPR